MVRLKYGNQCNITICTLLLRFTLSVMYQPIVLMDKLPFNDYGLYMISTSYGTARFKL